MSDEKKDPAPKPAAAPTQPEPVNPTGPIAPKAASPVDEIRPYPIESSRLWIERQLARVPPNAPVAIVATLEDKTVKGAIFVRLDGGRFSFTAYADKAPNVKLSAGAELAWYPGMPR